MINTFGAFIGMGILAIGIAILYYLGIKSEKASEKKSIILLPSNRKSLHRK